MPDNPCRCWLDVDSIVHNGHCCFLGWPEGKPMPCGHDTPERLARLRKIAIAAQGAETLTVGDLTANHLGLRLQCGELDGMLVGVQHELHKPFSDPTRATQIHLDGKDWAPLDPSAACTVETIDDWADAERRQAAYSVFPRQTCPHCQGEHPGAQCPEPDLFGEVPA